MSSEADAETDNLKVRMNLLQIQMLSVAKNMRNTNNKREVAVQNAATQAEKDIDATRGRQDNEPPLQGELNIDRFVVTVAYPNHSEHETHADVVDEIFCTDHETLLDRACGIAQRIEPGQRHIGFSARLPCVESARWTRVKKNVIVVHASTDCRMHQDTFHTHAADKTPLELRVQTLHKGDKTICMSLLISDQQNKSMQCALHVRCGLLTVCKRTDNNYVSLVHHCESDRTWLMATDVQKDDSLKLLSHCFHAMQQFIPSSRSPVDSEVQILCKNEQVCAFRLGSDAQSETLLSFTWRLSSSHAAARPLNLPVSKQVSPSSVPEHIQRARERVLRQCGFSGNSVPEQ
jgi:hypothetical protein